MKRFEAVIEAGDRGGAFVAVPFDVKEAFGSGRPKVRALIEQHITTTDVQGLVEPISILAAEFEEEVKKLGSDEARASEMEHAIRKHCTIHFDEDPAFYKRMSEKLDTLIAKHGDDWKTLAAHYEELRAEIRAGRGDDLSRGSRPCLRPRP